MSGAVRLACAHARHHSVRTCLLTLCVSVATLLPIGTQVIFRDFEERLLSRAASTPLLAGAKGSRFDLVMSALYFRRAEIGTIGMGEYEAIATSIVGSAFPMNTRFTARTAPIVATSPDYLEFRGLSVRAGRLPVMLGEAVLGARVAIRLGLSPGDHLYSDQRELFDLVTPAAIRMRIVGVLHEKGTPDDEAVFVDIKTAWVLEGLTHGHADAARAIPDALTLERSAQQVVVSEALVDDNEVTPENVERFHLHADPASLPITAVVVVPSSEKEMSILKARTNAGRSVQMVSPADAVAEMLGYVARVRQLLDGLSVVLLGFAGAMLGLVLTLSVRMREREIQTLSRIGVSRWTIRAMFIWECAGVVLLGVLGAAAVGVVLAVAPPNLVKLL